MPFPPSYLLLLQLRDTLHLTWASEIVFLKLIALQLQKSPTFSLQCPKENNIKYESDPISPLLKFFEFILAAKEIKPKLVGIMNIFLFFKNLVKF